MKSHEKLLSRDFEIFIIFSQSQLSRRIIQQLNIILKNYQNVAFILIIMIELSEKYEFKE